MSQTLETLRDMRNYTAQHYGEWPDEALREFGDWCWRQGIRSSSGMPDTESAADWMTEYCEENGL